MTNTRILSTIWEESEEIWVLNTWTMALLSCLQNVLECRTSNGTRTKSTEGIHERDSSHSSMSYTFTRTRTFLFLLASGILCILAYITVGSQTESRSVEIHENDPNSVFSQHGSHHIITAVRTSQRKPLPPETRGNRKLTSSSYHGNGMVTDAQSFLPDEDYIYEYFKWNISKPHINSDHKNGSVWIYNKDNITYSNIMSLVS